MPHTPTHVLVAGCGDLGTRVALRLIARGMRVTGLRRDPSQLPATVERATGDLTEGAFDVPASVDAIVIAVAPNVRRAGASRAGASGAGGSGAGGSRPSDAERTALYERTYLDGATHVLRRMAANTRLVFVSSTGVYGADDGRSVDEDTPPDPVTATGRVLLATEERVRDAGGTCLRLGGIYGPGRTRLVERARRYAAGELVARSHQHTNRVHVDDAAAIVEHLLVGRDLPEVLCGVDTASANGSATEADVLEFVARALGLATERARRDEDAPPSGKRVSSARLVGRGFRFRYPTFREGYAALVST